ncbi:FKBP-type peptidyl-prolyl cis-trans isomerase [Luteibacter sp. UNCMF366Tsu5.1]|uniref:FKBP-type peptidyl-prolyl cis-trans isomerase n=1 Tax=Luteibacter sp. UNCMF366Tsu5.1 TaxID=1502758 RepID=UPI000908D8F0|nr:FKBP-type peptidyl-prolyl cis-trans isomerase [Luteibacter sp. UNCMF366Tsu5.1]SFW59540.1 FKBP-type peptidyl-prolyl cis-trans isomerase FklB [Luteibacter sp. UNCMF366Tsu5.1]
MSPLRFLVMFAALSLPFAAVGAQSASTAPVSGAPAIDKTKLSYAIGYQIGTQFANSAQPDVDIAVLVKALQDGYAKRPPGVSIDVMQQQLVNFDAKVQRDSAVEFRRVAAANAKRSADFLARNRTRSGVVTLPSGIQYAVLAKGTGPQAQVTSTVVVNYRGALIDGTEFDSSYAHGKPVTFTVNRVIPGWQDVIPRMHVGDRWKVVIPPQLAYGERGELPRIGPNEALVFEIELMGIVP